MNIAGIELSRYVNQLYRERRIDLALVWSSIGFLLRRVPFINLEGGSVYHEIRLFGSRVSLHKRLKFLPGLVHYALPEVVCNRRAAKVVVPSEALKWGLVKLHGLAEAKVIVVTTEWRVGISPCMRKMELACGRGSCLLAGSISGRESRGC